MKKFLALVLALLMALSCFSFAGADGTTTEEEHKHTYDNTVGTNKPADHEPTCSTAGNQWNYCTVCKQWIETVLPADPSKHQPAEGAYTTVISKDCETSYSFEYSACKFCGKPYTVPADPNVKINHTWDETKTVVVPETCTKDGYTQKTCKVCGKTETMNTVPHHTATINGTGENGVYKLVPGQGAAHATCETKGITGAVLMCEKCHEIPKTYVNANNETVENYNEFIDVEKHIDADMLQLTADGKYFVDFAADFKALLNLTADEMAKGFTKTVDASKAPVYRGTKVTVTYVPAVAHKTEGSVTITCSCGYTKTVAIDCGTHTYEIVKVEYVDADGETARVMGTDVDWTGFEGRKVDESDNDYRARGVLWIRDHYNWNTSKPLDCTVPFIATYECECGDKKVAEYSMWTDHQMVEVGATYTRIDTDDEVTVPTSALVPACVPYTLEKACAHCAKTTVEEVAATKDHKMTDEHVYRASTCQVKGLKVTSCENDCGYSVISELPLQEHISTNKNIHIEKRVVKNATCTEKGSVTYTCADCKTTWVEEIPTLSPNGKHNDDGLKIVVNPTCTKDGKAYHYCTICGEKQGEDFVMKASHTFDTEKGFIGVPQNVKLVDGKPTWKDCSKEGHYSYSCAVCCKIFNVTKEAGSHTWKATPATTTKDAPHYEYVDDNTCRASWTETYECKNCEQKDPRTVTEDVKHEMSRIVRTLVKATCTREGSAIAHCDHCDKDYVVTLEKLEHTFVPTLDETTNKWIYKCECGATKDFNFGLPTYKVITTGITKGSRTNGTGKLELTETIIPVVSDVYVYIRWTYTLRDGDDFIFEDVRTVNDDLTFSAKGPTAPAGSTLTKVTIIATNDPAADDKDYDSMVKYGYTIMK